MSISTWKEEFYPVTATMFAQDDRENEVSKELTMQAIAHSMKKWSGLRIEELRKHEVYLNSWSSLCDYYDYNDHLSISADTCALCQFFLDEDNYCKNCPIVKLTGQRCDDDNCPYYNWVDNHDPEPMIKLLEDIYEWSEENL